MRISPRPTGQANTTDPDSRKVKATRGYDAQAVTTEQQFVFAAELTVETDVAQLAPMISHPRRELTAAAIEETLETVLADVGYWIAAHIEAIAAEGCQVLVPPDALKAGKPRPGRIGGLHTAMREALVTEAGGGLYRQRRWTVEPVFADIKFNPPRRPLSAPRQSRLPLGMAPDRRHADPAQALPPHHPILA